MKKKIIISILFALFIGIGIGVGATILIQSNQVLYKNDKTVEDALNDLYTKSNIGNATASDIKSGKTALVGGQEVTGSLTIPSYTNLSGTQSVGAGSYSTLLNGYYNLSDYRIKCGSNSCAACNSCCPSCPSVAGATGTFTTSKSSQRINVGFKPRCIAILGRYYNGQWNGQGFSVYCSDMESNYSYHSDAGRTPMPYSAGNRNLLWNIDSTGFTVGPDTVDGGTRYWFAIK